MSLYESISKQKLSNAELEEIISKVEKGEDLLFDSEEDLSDTDTLDISDTETLNQVYKIADDKMQSVIRESYDSKVQNSHLSLKSFVILSASVFFLFIIVVFLVFRNDGWTEAVMNFPYFKNSKRQPLSLSKSLENVSFKGDMSEIKRSLQTYNIEIEEKLNNLQKDFKNELSKQISIINTDLIELKDFRKKVESQVNIIHSRFDIDNLPQYIPVFKSTNGSLEIIPELKDLLKDYIKQYVSNVLLNNSTNVELQSSEKLYKKYLDDYFLQSNNTVLVNLRPLVTNDLFKKLDYDSIASKLTEKISADKLVISSATEVGLTSLIKKILNSKDHEDHFNFATYENGARVISELVSSFDSFNITELFLKQYSSLNNFHRKFFNFISMGLFYNAKFSPISENKKFQDKLVLNAYQTILPLGLPKDILLQQADYKVPTQTGVKTFGIKLQHPIYLSDVIIHYPKYLDSASTVFSAPKKIAIWIRLAKFEADFDKLQKYLYEKTKDRYSYVLNLEKLKEDASQVGNNEIPMKRVKSEEEIIYERFYESNFNLFENQYVKIGNMIYDQRSENSEQTFDLLDKSFKALKIQVDSLFFSIESNYGNDKFVTNLFKLKVHGVSEFDLYCMKQLLFNEEARDNYDSVNQDDLINMENLFNKRFIKNINYISEGTNFSATEADTANRIVIDDENIDYF